MKGKRGIIVLAMAALLPTALWRVLSAWGGAWFDRFAVPMLNHLHAWTAALPFPLLEPLALLYFAGMLCVLLCLPESSLRAMRRLAALLLIAVLPWLWLWFPGCVAATPPPEEARTAGQLEALCLRLCDGLDDGSAMSTQQILAAAPGVSGMPDARVKPARCTEWMTALDLAGLFAPWTGEALVNPAADPALLPFTCVHELMHLRGIADEGAANVAAWHACVDHGGAFARSARLWALRYALSELKCLDPSALTRILPRLNNESAALAASEIRTKARFSHLTALLGIQRCTQSYAGLLDALICGGIS